MRLRASKLSVPSALIVAHISGQPNSVPNNSRVIRNPATSANGQNSPPINRPTSVRMIKPNTSTGIAASSAPPMGNSGAAQ